MAAAHPVSWLQSLVHQGGDFVFNFVGGNFVRKNAQSARMSGTKARLASGYTDEALADYVPSLPGWGPIEDFNLFSG